MSRLCSLPDFEAKVHISVAMYFILFECFRFFSWVTNFIMLSRIIHQRNKKSPD